MLFFASLFILSRNMTERVVGVVTDSTCDLPAKMAREVGLEVVPLDVVFGKETFMDGVELTSSDFFDKLETSPYFPSTSAPPLGRFLEAYERTLERTGGISLYSIHLLDSASKTRENAEIALRQLTERDHRIRGIAKDSQQVSLGLGILARRAALLAEKKHSLVEIDEAMDKLRPHVRTICVLPTLTFARKGGRLSKVKLAKSYIGTFLGIVPIIEFKDGEMTDIGTSRIGKRLHTLVDKVRLLYEEHGKFEEIAIVHGNAVQDAYWVAGALDGSAKNNLGIYELGSTVAVHGGPGTIEVSILLAH